MTGRLPTSTAQARLRMSASGAMPKSYARAGISGFDPTRNWRVHSSKTMLIFRDGGGDALRNPAAAGRSGQHRK